MHFSISSWLSRLMPISKIGWANRSLRKIKKIRQIAVSQSRRRQRRRQVMMLMTLRMMASRRRKRQKKKGRSKMAEMKLMLIYKRSLRQLRQLHKLKASSLIQIQRTTQKQRNKIRYRLKRPRMLHQRMEKLNQNLKQKMVNQSSPSMMVTRRSFWNQLKICLKIQKMELL